MHTSVVHNLILLLRLGAFGYIAEGDAIVPMSPHKWRKLLEASEDLHILPYIHKGTVMCAKATNLSPIPKEAFVTKGEELQLKMPDTSKAVLYNHWTQRSWENVREEEMNSLTTSDATLYVLDLIIYNADAIITKDTDIAGIVALGYYIRSHSVEIDAEKLGMWLSRIGLVQLANLEGSMLIATMGFSQEELPFVKHPHNHAYQLFTNSIQKVFQEHTFSNVTRMNIAMLETLSYRFFRAISLITDIEE